MKPRYNSDNPVRVANTELPNAPDPNFGYVPPNAPDPMLGTRPPGAPDWTDSYADRMPNAPEPMTGSYAPQQMNTPDPFTSDYRPQMPGQLALTQDLRPRPPEIQPAPLPDPTDYAPSPPDSSAFAPEPPHHGVAEWPLVQGAEQTRVGTYWHN